MVQRLFVALNVKIFTFCPLHTQEKYGEPVLVASLGVTVQKVLFSWVHMGP